MASLNRVFLAGNLTRDPEVRYIPSGKAVADISMAISRRYKTATGEDREETCFVNVIAWGRQAETAGEYLKKGSGILVEGALKFDQWETNGEKKSRLRVQADRIEFLDRARRSDPSEAASESPRREESAPTGGSDGSAGGEPGGGDSDNLPF